MIGHIRSDEDRAARVRALRQRAARIADGRELVSDLSSPYGFDFDALHEEWAALEDGHDARHPTRDECGGVGGCPLMFRAYELEQKMIEVLDELRVAAQEARRA